MLKRLALLALFAATPAFAEDVTPQAYKNLLTPLLQSGTDILGAPIVYPEGAANVTAAIVTVPPGGQTGLHRHEVPLFAYILEGELTVDYGDKGKKTYRAGDALLEAQNWPHNGVNTGTVPLKLLALYMGGEGKQNTVAVPSP